MATTITPATLTVDIKETINLGGVQRSSTNTLTINYIKNIFRRIVTADLRGTGTTLLSFDQDNDGGATDGDPVNSDTSEAIPAWAIEKVKYIRITNLDATNNVLLVLGIDTDENFGAANDMTNFLLEPGKSFTYGCPHDSIAVNDSSAGANTALGDICQIQAVYPAGASYTHADLELYVAST